jgi:tRNA-2-methylthio-N6-dimethylallyladenosine synthase
VPEEVKKRRNIELLAVQEKISDELAKQFLGKEVKVLVEGPSKKARFTAEGAKTAEKINMKNSANSAVSAVSKFQLIGRTAEDWIVVFDGPVSLAGEFAKVKITRTSPLTLFGEMG